MKGELRCGVIDVWCRLPDDLEEFSYKTEMVHNSFKDGVECARDE